VLTTLARFDPSRLVTVEAIGDEMDSAFALGDRTIGLAIGTLIEHDLAERPNGRNGGARLTMRGRRLAPKIAD
jgi:hypothetical protein